MRGTAVALVAMAGAVGAAGCGDDENGETIPSVSIPSVTAPSVTAPTVPTTTVEEPTGGVAPDTPDDIITIRDRTKNKPDQTKPDSPENDVPPPEGSAQEVFEEFCEQHPEVCQ